MWAIRGYKFDFSEGSITAGPDDSLKRLKIDYVDLLQAHDVEFADAKLIIEETIRGLRKLQELGRLDISVLPAIPWRT